MPLSNRTTSRLAYFQFMLVPQHHPGRRRFGPQGWSRAYSFNTGDLVICSNVLTVTSMQQMQQA